MIKEKEDNTLFTSAKGMISFVDHYESMASKFKANNTRAWYDLAWELLRVNIEGYKQLHQIVTPDYSKLIYLYDSQTSIIKSGTFCVVAMGDSIQVREYQTGIIIYEIDSHGYLLNNMIHLFIKQHTKSTDVKKEK